MIFIEWWHNNNNNSNFVYIINRGGEWWSRAGCGRRRRGGPAKWGARAQPAPAAMQRLRTTFKRSRTPTPADMKTQSSLEVPKQVTSFLLFDIFYFIIVLIPLFENFLKRMLKITKNEFFPVKRRSKSNSIVFYYTHKITAKKFTEIRE